MKKEDYIKLINRILEQLDKKEVKRIWKCLLESLVKVEND